MDIKNGEINNEVADLSKVTDVDAKSENNGLLVYFPWGQIIVICGIILIGGFGLYSELQARLSSLDNTVATSLASLGEQLLNLSDSMDSLSLELKSVRETYNNLNTRVVILEKEFEREHFPSKVYRGEEKR